MTVGPKEVRTAGSDQGIVSPVDARFWKPLGRVPTNIDHCLNPDHKLARARPVLDHRPLGVSTRKGVVAIRHLPSTPKPEQTVVPGMVLSLVNELRLATRENDE